jgi:putative drug exporter of the RND superfamily
MTERLARTSARRPWLFIAGWAAAIVVSIVVVGTLLDGVLSSEARVTGNPESARAEQLINERFPAEVANQGGITEVVIVRAASPESAAGIAEDLRAAGASLVVTPAEDERLISADGDAFALLVALEEPPEETVKDVVAVVDQVDAEPAVEAGISGEWTLDADFQQLSQDDLRTGELFFGIPASLVILLLVFGAVVAGLVPLAFALMSIVVALALTALVGQAFELSVFVVNMLTGMGLALGIDYTLFILSRYREERARGREKTDAIGVAGATASRAVLFSGLAFVLAMTGMLLVPSSIMRSLAAGAILVGIVSVIAALTLLPAVLSLLGDRVNALRIPYFGRAVGTQSAQESRFWGRIVAFVMRRPVASLAVTVGLLIAAALPILSFETGSSGVSTLPDRFAAKHGFTLLNEEFPGQSTDPVQIVVGGDASSPEVQQGIERLRATLAENPLFGQPTVDANASGDTTLIVAPLAGDAVSEPAIEAVRELRAETVPDALAGTGAEVLVGGDTAIELEYHDAMDAWLPRVFTFVLGLSFILLAVAFRSVIVPATAIAMNLLAVGATYGLLVLVFIEGIGNEIFGFQQVDHIEAWVPLFLFSVLFGLSMDYQVFLLSRIREKFSETGDNRHAIAFGVGSTARLITGAALIIIAVFWGFAMGDLVMFQQMGFGIAVALLIDATLIRSIVVPATMTLLGKWNWYLPSWLEWLPDVNVEGAESPRRESARPAHAQSGSSAP